MTSPEAFGVLLLSLAAGLVTLAFLADCLLGLLCVGIVVLDIAFFYFVGVPG